MPISLNILGQRLKQARHVKGLTQEQTAERIGFSVAHLSKIERGQKPINIAKLAELCDVLDVPMEWVITGAALPENADHNRAFGEIVKGCPQETVEILLAICREAVRIRQGQDNEGTKAGGQA